MILRNTISLTFNRDEDMQLNPVHLKLSRLLEGRLFRIPEYQRAYSWATKQREDLFADIVEAHRSGREHFMATVVALAKSTRTIGVDDFQTVELVDGQQRITTLIILLKAINKKLDPEDALEQKIQRETRELLVKGDDHSLILLQTNHDSSHIFTTYLRSGELNETAAKTASDRNLLNAAHECEAFVDRWKRSGSITDLVATLKNKLSMIYHELADEATVYRVFEVLNSRGLDVKWIDKLKSQLLALIFEHTESGTREEAVREMQVTWQKIYRVLGLRVNLGDEALRFLGTWSRKSRPNRIISQEDATTELTKVAGAELKSIMAVGKKLEDVVEALNDLDRNIRLRAVTRIAHARFVAAAIMLRDFEDGITQDLLKKWENTTFRIFELGGADTRHKVGDYVRLGYEIFTTQLSSEKISARLSELSKGYKIDDVLKVIYWDDSYNNWTEQLRYLLYRFDEHLAEQSGERLNHSQWNKIWSEEASKSIEHIQPQSSAEPYIHHLGNLCLLPPGVNSSLKAKPPQEKASTYTSCGLRATSEVGNFLSDGNLWNETAVRERAQKIEDFIRKEWAD